MTKHMERLWTTEPLFEVTGKGKAAIENYRGAYPAGPVLTWRPATREQRVAVKRLWDRSSDGATGYRAFRRRFKWAGIGSDRYLFGKWCGMWVGIEEDGHTHT